METTHTTTKTHYTVHAIDAKIDPVNPAVTKEYTSRTTAYNVFDGLVERGFDEVWVVEKVTTSKVLFSAGRKA